MLLNEETKKL